jgi:hypothetical protein
MSNIRKKCINCSRIYIGDGYKESCTRECFFKKKYEEHSLANGRYGKKHKVKTVSVHKHICKQCNQPFESNRKNSAFCSFGCSRTQISQDKQIQAANERWLNPKPRKKPKKPKSFAQLNREAEWRRVWDDESWARNYNSYRG